MSLKVPAFLSDHPFEGLVAAILLLGLLFISADGGFAPSARDAGPTAAERN